MEKKNLFTSLLIGNNTRLLDISMLLLRCVIGLILFVIGSGKVLGWFGGMGMAQTVQAFGKGGFSPPLVYLSSYTEFIGGILLIIGFLTRPIGVAVMINMIVATIVMLPNGLVGPTSAALPLTVLVVDIAILIAGPMDYSIDFLITRGTGKSTVTESELPV
ncbi:MAG TPA: DoxX family protein [Balneolales bacterium]|nr:DoxX family protein [Balneolales bacterium]